MTDDAGRCLDRLSYHQGRLDILVRLLGDSGSVMAMDVTDLAAALYREIRDELCRDYDALEHRDWSKTEAVYVPALYATFVAMSGGSVLRPLVMIGEVKRAHKVIDGALQELRERSGEREGT